jgi:pimeloyl-ACP methyl ester carboxylesterase
MRDPRWPRLFVVSLPIGIGLLSFLMIESFARQMLYPAPPVKVPSPPPAPLEEVWLDLETGDRVAAWAYQPPGLPEDAPVVLFFHGNGENLETLRWSRLFEQLGELGVVVLAPDYPGYGRSSGKPSEKGLIATGDAAVAWARKTHPGRPLVVCGWSLGAALAIATVDRHPEEVRGLIALSAWTTLAEVAVKLFPEFAVKMMLREHYDSRSIARRVRVPALVVHGEHDDLIPFAQGKEIASALAGTVRWVEVRGAAHNDLLAHRQVWDEMKRFLSGL